MTAGLTCRREVFLADPDEPVREAAARMRERRVGTLVALDDRRRPVGIVTDRDLVARVLADDARDDATPVRDVMTLEPATVSEDTPLDDAVGFMRDRAIRRLLVVDDEGELVGLLSVDDVLDALVGELAAVVNLIRRQAPE